MIAYLPIPGGHIALAERFVDPSFSFAMGWNYWYDTYLWSLLTPVIQPTSLLGSIGPSYCLQN